MRLPAALWIVVAASATTIQASPACTADDYRDRCATSIVAHPAILDADAGTAPLTLTAMITETATGEPIEGRIVEFTTPQAIGSTSICSAVSDAAGVASCGDLAGVATAASGRRVVAQFDGDPSFLPSADSAPVIRAGGSDLP